MSSERTPERARLLDKAKTLATTPGVYLMKDTEANILYVGKAKSLKNRVTSYFQPLIHEHPRTELLLTNVIDFEVIHTETENEALVLECTLIKRYRPKFNVRLKDDKHYPYIQIPTDVDFPKLEWVRRVSNPNARYFGPFPSGYAARIVLRLLTEHFRLRDCSDNTFSHRSRACILYQMDQCSAPCVQKISKEDYQALIQKAIAVLEGRGQALIQELKLEMSQASEEERYEDAARVRDQIRAIEVVSETQSVSNADTRLDLDVFAFERNEHQAQGVVLQVRGGKLLTLKHYQVQNFDASIPDAELMADFLAQHVLLMSDKNEIQQAKEVLIRQAPENLEWLENSLGIRIRVPEGEQQTQLLNVAHTNARYALENARAESGGHGIAALEEVQKKLGLERLPRRIECYDVSNTQGEDSVASRVVFIDGAPDKNLYRRYKIKTVKGANDFASMREIFDRRFSKMDLQAGNEKPDLVVVDGGKGQLAQAQAIFDELNIQGVDLVSLAKARTEKNFKASEVESSQERIFVPGRVNPVALYPHTKAFKLLTHVRDEAHRFAITFHRNLRHKRSLGES